MEVGYEGNKEDGSGNGREVSLPFEPSIDEPAATTVPIKSSGRTVFESNNDKQIRRTSSKSKEYESIKIKLWYSRSDK